MSIIEILHTRSLEEGIYWIILKFRYSPNTKTELIFFYLNLWYKNTFFGCKVWRSWWQSWQPILFTIYDASKNAIYITCHKITDISTQNMRHESAFHTNSKLLNHDANNEHWTLHVRWWQRLKRLETFSINISCRVAWTVEMAAISCNFNAHYWMTDIVWWKEFFNLK